MYLSISTGNLLYAVLHVGIIPTVLLCLHISNSAACFRFIYDLSDQDSSRAREIERVMREARLRELCKVTQTTTNVVFAKVAFSSY